MTATVRLFSHSGLQALPIESHSGQNSENGVFVLKQPYLAAESISATTGSAQSSAAALSASNGTKILQVDVQQGKIVHFEVTPNGSSARTATTSSPRLKGVSQLAFGPGWTISLLEGDLAS
jgi:hypothetical protein